MSQSLSMFCSIPRQTAFYLTVALLWPFCANANTSSESERLESRRVEEKDTAVQTITLKQAVLLAKKQSPVLVAARHRQSEAKHRWKAASIPPFNPQLSGAIGPRFNPRSRSAMTMHGSASPSIDASVGLRQWIETGGQGALRKKVAEVGMDVEVEQINDVERQLVRELSLAFVSALYWQRRLLLAEENIRIDQSTADIASRRHEVGDGGGLDVSVAALRLLRGRSEKERVKAKLVQVLGELKIFLGFPAASALRCRGKLREFSIADKVRSDMAVDGSNEFAANHSEQNPPKIPRQNQVRTGIDAEEIRRARPDLRAQQAQIRQAEAQAKLGRAYRAPNLALGAMYSREESANIVQGTLRIALPVFDHGQGKVAIAQARSQRLRAEADAIENKALIESRTAWDAVQRYDRALREFEASGLDILEQAERAASISYEEGAIPLAELLALRRELVQAKLSYTDLLLGAANAGVEYKSSIGALR